MYEPAKTEIEQRISEMILELDGMAVSYMPRLARLELMVEETLSRLSRAAVVPCDGNCGRAEPVLQDSRYGQRSRIGEWICPDCHRKVCGTEITEYHDCKALRE